MKRRRGNPGLQGRLLENSIEAYVMALETINRLSIKYRVETLSYLICNAWELMLKSKIVTDAGDNKAIYHKKKRGEPRRSLALRDCLKKTFPDKDPTRCNVELVADLRDEATHLVISRVPNDVLALFQACVLNYHKRLNGWWGISLADRIPVGMMTLVYDLGPERLDLSSSVLRRQLGADTVKYLSEFGAQVRREFEELGRPAELSIDIDYRLVLTKKPKDADIALTIGSGGEPMGKVEVAKDAGKTHPYRQKELIEEVNSGLPDGTSINQHDVRCIKKVHKVESKPEFYYKSDVKGSPKQYSRRFVEWMLEQYGKDSSFFGEMRRKAA